MERFDRMKVTIMGLGLFGGGLGVTEYFCTRGADVLVTDLSTPEKLRPSLEKVARFPIRLRLGSHEMSDFTTADIVIVNPAVPIESPYIKAALEAGAQIDTELNIFLRNCNSPVTAITGTNGKSTTTALIHHIVARTFPDALLGGNIGRSLLGMLDRTAPDNPAIVEISSFQLEHLRWLGKSPHIAVVTNITPNHLDRHKTMEAYAEAKRAIVDYQSDSDIAVLNADDPLVAEFSKSTAARVMYFSRKIEPAEGAFLRGSDIVMRYEGEEQSICSVHDLSLKGDHNVENALAAVAAARCILGSRWNRSEVIDALRTFAGLEHRLEFVREHKGVRYYNDSIATNPISVIVALKAFSAPKVLIAGGFDKQLPFDEMAASIVSENVKAVMLVGQTKDAIREAVEAEGLKSGRTVITRSFETFEQAVLGAAEVARWGDIVLMSPACASYGMFVNFEQRGRIFKEIVGRLT